MNLNGTSGNNFQVELVRTPEQFYARLRDKFDVAGFSHYVWNANLSRYLARHLKIVQPKCIVAFGGPHLPIYAEGQQQYLRALPEADFFIEKEGEIAFNNLCTELYHKSFDAEKVKEIRIKSVRSIVRGELISSPLENRISDLDSVESPYLGGLLDEFLEQGFTPMLENNRGCPFSCDFCGEGDKYHSHIARHSLGYLKQEYEYVARKMSSLRNLPFHDTVYFTDSNTGMYHEDLELCGFLRELQDRYHWPRKIITSTGKNSKDRVIRCSELLDGALMITASVQSTDPEVLANVKRKNISIEVLTLVAKGGGEGRKSFSEIILGLPGDSYARHLKSIKDMADIQVNDIRTSQLMILPDTPMTASEYKERFKLQTKFRILVKGFEKVEVGDSSELAVECEEICVGTENLSFEDSLRCRAADLLVNIFYNNILSPSTFSFFHDKGLLVSAYLQKIFDLEKPEILSSLISQYEEFLKNELFDSPEDMARFLKQPGVYEKLETGEIGKNPFYYFSEKMKAYPKEITAFAQNAAEAVAGEELAARIVKDLCCAYGWELTSLTKRLSATSHD
ncbi:MAG: hypothetical protein WCU88_02335 [Elusimicrobiota bacterium]|jgi:radical SAM superfamily enzyme YgiQ (UPF0313 family)